MTEVNELVKSASDFVARRSMSMYIEGGLLDLRSHVSKLKAATIWPKQGRNVYAARSPRKGDE